MNDDDRKLLAGCFGAITAVANTVMIGVTFIYVITHW